VLIKRGDSAMIEGTILHYNRRVSIMQKEKKRFRTTPKKRGGSDKERRMNTRKSHQGGKNL